MILIISIISFFILIKIYPFFISWQKKKSYGQFIRKEGPDLHNYKEGTPTAGGILFIITIFILNLLLYFYYEKPIYLIISISSILFGFIGFLDDFISISKKNSTGLTSKQKFLLQIIFSFIMYILIIIFQKNTEILIPFIDISFDLSYFYPIWVIVFITGVSNSVNLTDGLDGLSSGTYILSIFFTSLIIRLLFDINVAFLFPIVFSVIAFLFYNIKPAKIFMGDTGSLGLGGIIGSIAVFYSIEIFLIFTCIIFFMEVFSVIIQVSSFKLRNKRIFLMSPIHHHFELLGWNEERVVMFFWFINIIFGIIIVGGYI